MVAEVKGRILADSEQMLIEHRFFADLEAAFRPVVGSCAKMVDFDAGQYLFHEDDPADWFYLIRHGRVALEVTVPGRGVITFETVGDSDVLGMFWLMPRGHWSHDARARELTHAIAIEAKCLREKCERDHAFGYDLMKRFVPILLRRLENAQLQILDVYGLSK